MLVDLKDFENIRNIYGNENVKIFSYQVETESGTPINKYEAGILLNDNTFKILAPSIIKRYNEDNLKAFVFTEHLDTLESDNDALVIIEDLDYYIRQRSNGTIPMPPTNTYIRIYILPNTTISHKDFCSYILLPYYLLSSFYSNLLTSFTTSNLKTLFLEDNIQENVTRFSSAVWFENIQKKSIILAGLGGIGSYVAFLLGRLNVKELVLYDADVVETVNMSGQLYGKQQLGISKVSATAGLLQNFCNFSSYMAKAELYTELSGNGPIMICGFDNMKARKVFYTRWLEYVKAHPTEANTCLFIDGRLAAEELQILCIKGDDTYSQGIYEANFLFEDSEAQATICSYKQTTFMANMIASLMVNLFVNAVANECSPVIERDLPFYTEYNAEIMYLKTTY